MMTDPTPAATAEEAARTLAERFDTLELRDAYSPPQFTGAKTGHGRWVRVLLGGHPLADVWTNDSDGIGYIPRSERGRMQTPDWVMSFSRAKATGQTATEVFARIAALAGLGMSAEPVQEGDLDMLEE